MYSFIYYLARTVFKLLGGRFTVHNKERIPDTAFVVVCTHRTWLDIIYLAIALHPYKVHFMAKQELFSFPPAGRFLASINAFPVNRAHPGPSVLKEPLKRLKSGKIVGIFPSGTRNAEQASLKRGAVTIAMKADVRILPAVYSGPLSFTKLLLRKPAYIRFGDAICPPDADSLSKEAIAEKMAELQDAFERLQSSNPEG